MKALFTGTSKKIFIISLSLVSLCHFQSLYAQNGVNEVNEELDTLSQANQAWDRFSASFGGFFSTYSSGILLRSQQLGLGLQINVEDALGLETTVFALRGNAKYRIGKTKRHSLMFGYFGIHRTARKTLDEELELGDNIFPVGTEVTSKFNFSIWRVKYNYAFYQDKRVSIGSSLGLFIMPVNLTVKALGLEEHTTNFVAPLPLLGLRTDFQITPKLYLKQSVEFLYLSFADFKGRLLDLSASLEHKTFQNIAFGFGINSNRINISLKKPDSSIEFFGDIRMDYTGLVLYGRYYF